MNKMEIGAKRMRKIIMDEITEWWENNETRIEPLIRRVKSIKLSKCSSNLNKESQG